MKTNIKDFQKTKDFLVCVDSDGCVMDTMEVKHKEAFGPEAVNIWGLHEIRDRFLKVWNDINLYTKKRGINRFKGVVETFEQLKREGYDMPDISSFKNGQRRQMSFPIRLLNGKLKKQEMSS